MRRLRPALLAAVTLAVTLSGQGAGAVAGQAPARGGTPAAVPLVTGDLVLVHRDPDGRERLAVQPRPDAPGHSYTIRKLHGDTLVVPAAAVPYLGRVLDPGLFDVSALLRDGASDRLPVRISYAAGSPVAAPPGVTVTGRPNATTADGYLTPAGAREFGAALDRQVRTDAGRPDSRHGGGGGTAVFGGVTGIRYAGSRAPEPAQPRFPMHTLRLNVLDPTGAPVSGAGIDVVNVDDSRKYTGFVTATDGEARISVPAGNYGAMIYYPTYDDNGLVEERLLVTRFVVDAPREVTLDLRTASSRVTVATPRPARLIALDLSVYQGSDDLIGLGLSTGSDGSAPMYVSPTPGGAGALHLAVHGRLESTPYAGLSGAPPYPAAIPYSYDVEFVSDGSIGADQRYRAEPASLATLDNRYHAEVDGLTGGATRFGMLPWELVQFRSIYPLRLPLRRTEYVSAIPNLLYHEGVYADYAGFPPMGELYSGPRAYLPGQETTVDWYRGPLHPGTVADTGNGAYQCPACRIGDTLSVLLAPVIDSEPDHGGALDFNGDGVESTSRFQLFRGAEQLADWLDTAGGDVTVPADPATYRLVYDQTRTTTWTHQSTSSHAEWTFGSEHSDAQTVPDRWSCGLLGSADQCSAVSLLALNYQLTEGLDNHVPVGPGSLLLTVGHSSGAPSVPITAATVEISSDGGHTWTPTVVSDLGSGRYSATWTYPTAGGTAAFRVTARDANRATILEVVKDAVTVGVAPTARAAAAAPASFGGPATFGGPSRPACDARLPGQFRCLALYRPGSTRLTGPPEGYGPADLRAAYQLSDSGGAGHTVAVVVAGDYPTAEADLATYRKEFGLPTCAAVTGCFRKVNQRGDPEPLPDPDPGWAVEAAVDLQMVSAACPDCRLMLVEGDSGAFEALAEGVDSAVRLGASVVSNSYGAEEFRGMADVAGSYHHPGVPILAASGDYGFTTAAFPAVYGPVIAVGGTTLTRTDNARGWNETAWSGSGSGCSAWIDKPPQQDDANCAMRTVADISALADPEHGVAVYDSFQNVGWVVIGGTSVSTPYLAGLIALTGHPETVTPESLYDRPDAYFDVIGGSNGFCGEDYLCTGLPGYDAPTGWGTPRGLAPFG